MARRRALSREVERDVLVEAGHRCAIPACHALHPEVHHIKPVAEGGSDEFENLIALCPNCHGMADRGEIDRKAMRQYKASLSVLDHRYSSMERRVLEYMANGHMSIDLPAGFEIMLWYLIEDGYLSDGVNQRRAIARRIARGSPRLRVEDVLPSVPDVYRYHLTSQGQEFIQAWLRAEDIE
jgi:hypothetical protein